MREMAERRYREWECFPHPSPMFGDGLVFIECRFLDRYGLLWRSLDHLAADLADEPRACDDLLVILEREAKRRMEVRYHPPFDPWYSAGLHKRAGFWMPDDDEQETAPQPHIAAEGKGE